MPDEIRDDDAIPILVRTDAAGCTHEFLDAVVEMECTFSASMRIDEPARQAILALAQSAWTPAIRQDTTERDSAWVTELDGLDLSAWPTGSRAICRRERPHPGAQMTFADADGHRFQVMLTNQQGDPVALEAKHRARARVEASAADLVPGLYQSHYADQGKLVFRGTRDYFREYAWS